MESGEVAARHLVAPAFPGAEALEQAEVREDREDRGEHRQDTGIYAIIKHKRAVRP